MIPKAWRDSFSNPNSFFDRHSWFPAQEVFTRRILRLAEWRRGLRIYEQSIAF
jgi:hypothetical protein